MDKQIIKALECCKSPVPMCDDCPVGEGDMCFDFLKGYALDLINRQKAEIERKGRIIESYALQYGTAADKEVFLRKVRAEAIREFAKRLKEKSYIPDPYWKMSVVDEYRIDNLVKEMTEGQI